jgi:hypothetical protein
MHRNWIMNKTMVAVATGSACAFDPRPKLSGFRRHPGPDAPMPALS